MLTKMQTEWVLEFLSGSGPLGDMLLRRKASLDFSSAIVFPKAASRLGLDFQWGLPIEDRFHGGVSEFVCEIKRRLNEDCTFCFMRECDFKRYDPCMSREKCPMVFVGDDILYLLEAHSDDEQIVDTINAANRFMLMLLFSNDDCRFGKGDSLTYGQIETMLCNLMAVAVGIFDDEGVCYIPVHSTKGRA